MSKATLEAELKQEREKQALLTRQLSTARGVAGRDIQNDIWLTPNRKQKLEALFKAIDKDNSGAISKIEAIEFGQLFVEESNGGVDAERFFQELDTDKSADVSLSEWLNFFGRLSIGLDDKDFDLYISNLQEYVAVSKRPIKWGYIVRPLFIALTLIQLGLCIAILFFAVNQKSLWSTVNGAVSKSFPSTNLRMAFSIIGIAACVLGAVAGVIQHATMLVAFASISTVVFALNVASIVGDAVVLNDALNNCLDACVATGLTSSVCKCSVRNSPLIPLGLSTVSLLTSIFPAFVAIYYSTSCWRSKFLKNWGNTFAKLSGISAIESSLVHGLFTSKAK